MSSCGGFTGRPSDDGILRVYTRDECEGLSGSWHANGECSRPEGGSFSYDCREINKDPMDWFVRNRYMLAAGAVVVAGGVWWSMRKKS